MCIQIDFNVRPSIKALTNNRMLRNKKAKIAKRVGEELKIWEYENQLDWKIYETDFKDSWSC